MLGTFDETGWGFSRFQLGSRRPPPLRGRASGYLGLFNIYNSLCARFRYASLRNSPSKLSFLTLLVLGNGYGRANPGPASPCFTIPLPPTGACSLLQPPSERFRLACSLIGVDPLSILVTCCRSIVLNVGPRGRTRVANLLLRPPYPSSFGCRPICLLLLIISLLLPYWL